MNIIVNKITTAIACINTNRNYIGFELDKQYVEIARRRINAAREQFHEHMEVAKRMAKIKLAPPPNSIGQ